MSGLLVKNGRIVQKLVINANPGLEVNQIITFSSIQLFVVLFICIRRLTQNRRPNNIQKTSPQSYKTH